MFGLRAWHTAIRQARFISHFARGYSAHHVPQSSAPVWLPKELHAAFESYKHQLLDEYTKLTESISSGDTSSKESAARWNSLRPIADVLEELDVLVQTDGEVERLVSEVLNSGADGEDEAELVEMVRVEREQRDSHRRALERKLFGLLVPPDPEALSAGACLELVAGAGGREAGLFARDLLDMYRCLAVDRGWTFSVVQESTMTGDETTTGGSSESPISKACVQIVGEPREDLLQADTLAEPDCRVLLGAYGQLRWEAGVHRVQRVPVTSKQSKIHTSTVAVSVLPLTDDVQIDLSENDLKWDYFRSSGAGGQHVNRTDSAVRLTHLPTGTVVTCQRERSQHVNKQVALETLVERLRDMRYKVQSDTIDSLRRAHLGHLDRSEKIRTYNFPQDRITDHRLGRTWNGMQRFMRQTIGLSEAIQALFSRDQAERLRHLLVTERSDTERKSRQE